MFVSPLMLIILSFIFTEFQYKVILMSCLFKTKKCKSTNKVLNIDRRIILKKIGPSSSINGQGFQTLKQKFQSTLLILLTAVLFKYYLVNRGNAR